ncbi:Toxin-antitoxin toxin family protein (plasmid) [Pseudomonas antarctica]|uniref:Toxin-antitoxin toxin family protein n=1 Tax=Pseudomonas antarctica TaxID=219572 RepID=A0A172ZA36_9PSED|nr:type II toxin-antitoxin system HigB family toxin [Pseudomonas antarctica]ANF89212.1 Toxin-antitoxin toxin family protein [Pseudomonas antarctica]
MDVLLKQRFQDAEKRYPNDQSGLRRCLRLLTEAEPKSYADLEKIFGHTIDLFKYRADDCWVVIDIGGNNLRLIAGVNYVRQKLYVKHIYTHADYDKATEWYASNKRGIKP